MATIVMRLSGLAIALIATAASLLAQPRPDAAALESLIQRMKQSALRYEGRLPDFSCTQVTVRKEPSGNGAGWRTQDSFEESVAFAPGGSIAKKLVKWNGQPTSKSKPGGVTETAILALLIVPQDLRAAAEAKFEWDHWETRTDHRIAVLAYQAVGENSPDGKTRYELKITGRVFYDDTAGNLVRIESSNVGPPGYRFGEVRVETDYAPVTLSDRELILPTSAVVAGAEGKQRYRHEIQFSAYSKYQADSTLRFDEGR